MALQHGFQHYQTIIPLEKAKPSTQHSTQANPAPDQQAKHPASKAKHPALVTGKTTGKAHPASLKGKPKNNRQSFALGVRHPKANPAKQKGPLGAD